MSQEKKLELTVDEGQSTVNEHTSHVSSEKDVETDSGFVEPAGCDFESEDRVPLTSDAETSFDKDDISSSSSMVSEGEDSESAEGESVTSEEEEQSTENIRSYSCNGCGSSLCNSQLLQCSGCKSVLYCSRKCQLSHRGEHKVLCNAIQHVHKDLSEKLLRACTYINHITPKQQNKIINLIGEQCVVDCQIAGKISKALWDTGSQVCLLSTKWLAENGITAPIRDIKEALGKNVRIEGVNGNSVPYEGYIVLRLQINGNFVDIPFLVTKENVQKPIIGYNIIPIIIGMEKGDKPALIRDIFQQSGRDVDVKALSAVMSTLESTSGNNELSPVQVTKKGATVKAGSSKTVSFKIKSLVVSDRTPVVFEPEVEELLPHGITLQSSLLYLRKGNNTRISVNVVNTSTRDISLPGRLQVGELHQVTSVTPVQVEESEFQEGVGVEDEGGEVTVKVEVLDVKETVEEAEGAAVEEEDKERTTRYWEQIMKIDLSKLTVEEQNTARQMLWEEREAFAIDADDIGDAKDLELELKTTDENPVQHRYNNIPRHLMGEVKTHIEDLLNREWITHSKSAWSSPLVLVRKKDGALRLCCDFRRLNKKTISDKHPLPRVQASLDSLGGSKWFSVVDQSHAYYQGSEDRHKTAFVTPWGLYQWV